MEEDKIIERSEENRRLKLGDKQIRNKTIGKE